MTDQAERYDRIAHGYATWWAPVLAPQATALLDDLDAAVAAGARRILDIGTGTGTLAIAAIRRWPTVEVVGIDVSAEMARAAEGEANRELSPAERARFEAVVAPADRLPFPERSFDLAMSSFVLQLVPNRFRALREARRVLRPGGTLAYVTWLVDIHRFPPDDDLDATLDEIGIGAREADPRPGDVPTVEGAVAQLRRAGFRDVRGERRVLEHAFTREGYTRFVTEFDEEDLVASLSRRERRQFDTGLAARLARRTADELTLRYPIVRASGRRP